MKVIRARNVHNALPLALLMMDDCGVRRESRNGQVITLLEPVATVYERPEERVIFWPSRNANPFFHLYEAMWMLQGREDVAPLTRYAKNMENYSDNGTLLAGAYGYRWRKGFELDQIPIIIERLRENPNDRRCVLQMWDPMMDLGQDGKDIPCNLTVTFQIGYAGELNMVVFNRSNDIIWGCYGANAVHFSFLQEYIAAGINCPIGTYTQVSVNWHVYTQFFENLKSIPVSSYPGKWTLYGKDPYTLEEVIHIPLFPTGWNYQTFDHSLAEVMKSVDSGNFEGGVASAFLDVFVTLMKAHYEYKRLPEPENFDVALSLLRGSKIDWFVAGREWVQRRRDKWELKQNTLGEA